MPPTVGVVFAPGGSADLRDLVRQRRTGLHVLLLLPLGTHERYPEFARLGASLLRGAWVIGSSDPAPSSLDGIVTFSDQLIELAASCAQDLGLPWGVPARAVDKYRQRVILAETGLTRVRASLARSREELWQGVAAHGLPGLVKSRRGHGGERVWEVSDAAVAEVIAPALGEWAYYETTIPDAPVPASPMWLGDMVSVEVATTRRGDVVAVAAFSKLPLHRMSDTAGGEPSRLVTTGNLYPWALKGDLARRTLRLAEEAVRALDIRSTLTHVEIKLGAEGPDVVEVNCRMGGHLDTVARAANGPDLVGVALTVASGGTVAVDDDGVLGVAERVPPRLAVGVRVPFPAPVADHQLSRQVDRSEVDRMDGVEVVDVRSKDRQTFLADDYAANLTIVASSSTELESRLASVLGRVSQLYSADGVPDTAWMSAMRRALPSPAGEAVDEEGPP